MCRMTIPLALLPAAAVLIGQGAVPTPIALP